MSDDKTSLDTVLNVCNTDVYRDPMRFAMTPEEIDQGVDEVVDYFSKPENHGVPKDVVSMPGMGPMGLEALKKLTAAVPNQVSVEEMRFAIALGRVGPAGEKLIRQLIHRDHRTLFQSMGELQKEGRLNDKARHGYTGQAVTLRDLYALRRGTGYHGESLGGKVEAIRKQLATPVPDFCIPGWT